MRPYQFQFLQTPSAFWNTSETAGPTTWDVLRFWDVPRPLRPTPRSRPLAFGPWNEPERCRDTEASDLAHFWRQHYNGEDWVFDPEPEWIAKLLHDPSTLALIVREPLEPGQIVGSIVCRSLTGEDGTFRLGSLELSTAYIIEGLCIHPSWRGRHLAGWLIAWIDHLINTNQGPQAFFWSREAPPRDLTYVASHTYGYLPLSSWPSPSSTRLDEARPEEISWSTFQRIWTSHIRRWDSYTSAAFPTHLPSDPLRVWKSESTYIVVSDTRRRVRQQTQSEHGRIWEVQFCGDLYDPVGSRRDGDGERGWRRVLEAVGSMLVAEGERGLLFVSSASWQGGCDTTWPAPWRVGTAGIHTTYIYNYMPPVFHRLATLFLRNEL